MLKPYCNRGRQKNKSPSLRSSVFHIPFDSESHVSESSLLSPSHGGAHLVLPQAVRPEARSTTHTPRYSRLSRGALPLALPMRDRRCPKCPLASPPTPHSPAASACACSAVTLSRLSLSHTLALSHTLVSREIVSMHVSTRHTHTHTHKHSQTRASFEDQPARAHLREHHARTTRRPYGLPRR